MEQVRSPEEEIKALRKEIKSLKKENRELKTELHLFTLGEIRAKDRVYKLERLLREFVDQVDEAGFSIVERGL